MSHRSELALPAHRGATKGSAKRETRGQKERQQRGEIESDKRASGERARESDSGVAIH